MCWMVSRKQDQGREGYRLTEMRTCAARQTRPSPLPNYLILATPLLTSRPSNRPPVSSPARPLPSNPTSRCTVPSTTSRPSSVPTSARSPFPSFRNCLPSTPSRHSLCFSCSVWRCGVWTSIGGSVCLRASCWSLSSAPPYSR